MVEKILSKLNEERIDAVQRHKMPDQVPYLFYEDGWVSCQRFGVSVEKYMKDPRTMLDIQVRNAEALGGGGYMGGLFVDLGITMPPEALGASIRYDEKNMPWIDKPIIREPKDLERLEVPDPDKSEPMVRAVECYLYLKEHAPEGLEVEFFPILGPVDVSCLLRGTSEFMADLILRPDFAHELLEIITETNIVWLKKIDEVVGGLEVVKLGDDYSGYLSRKTWEELPFPYLKRIFETIPKAIRWFHTDGPKIMQPGVLESLAGLGIDVTFALHSELDLADAKKRLQPLNIAMAWGIPPVEVLLRGPPEKIDERCRQCIETAGLGGNYILAPSGGDSPGTPVEHYHVVMRAAEKYGRYPIQVGGEG